MRSVPAPASPPSWIEVTGIADRGRPAGPRRPLLATLAADLRANAHGLPAHPGAGDWLRAMARQAPTVRFAAVLLLRLAQSAGRTVPLLGALLKQLNHVVCGCDIAWEADIAPGLVLFHPTGVVIGPACAIGPRAVLMQGVTVGSTPEGSPTIGENVFLGPGACVLGPVTVGDEVVAGANAVVVSSVEPGVVVGGVPARV
ncbi:MAG: putative serine acetyltransferase, partial [Solirubrobacteraceae bacterium]|nr:putative serine acetyltransferase [Solirubrobacteraceae bacterium]